MKHKEFAVQYSRIRSLKLHTSELLVLHNYDYILHNTYIQIYIYTYTQACTSASLAQRAFYLALHSSLFGPDGAVNYDYIVTNSINSLLIGSTCILNGTHNNQFGPYS